MRENFYWENGERVQVVGPVYYDDVDIKMDSPETVIGRTIIGFLLQRKKNPELSIQCFSLVLGIGYDGKSMTEIARENYVSRAAVSHRCISICKAIVISPVRAMRRIEGQENCRAAQIKRQTELLEKYEEAMIV